MAKLYFRYGAMGSSKTAQALMTKFNFEEKGMKVWLIKPSTDIRDGETRIRSRIGLSAEADVIRPDVNIYSLFNKKDGVDAVIADECQFFTESQIEELAQIVDVDNIPVLCFGLRTDFQSRFFSGSRRLMEIADSIEEIKTVCKCGKKATINARIDENGKVVTAGSQIVLGGNDRYLSMCRRCWKQELLGGHLA